MQYCHVSKSFSTDMYLDCFKSQKNRRRFSMFYVGPTNRLGCTGLMVCGSLIEDMTLDVTFVCAVSHLIIIVIVQSARITCFRGNPLPLPSDQGSNKCETLKAST